MIRAMSIAPANVMQKLVNKGRGCEIHPSAVVEASTLGDYVKVGANAVVRFSHLGDSVRIGDQANVQYSVLGDHATVARMGMLQSCVLHAGANSGHYGLQLCVVGRDTFVGGECILGDFKPGSTIQVFHEGELVDTGTNTLGCAVGHDCAIMMRATFYAGREIPNGVTIIGPPGDIVAKIPPGLPKNTPLMAVGGVLQPYANFERRAPPRDNPDPQGTDSADPDDEPS
jgi:NDP-sugar pyrophosphorylase family protein